jgi:hypothetical protein
MFMAVRTTDLTVRPHGYLYCTSEKWVLPTDGRFRQYIESGMNFYCDLMFVNPYIIVYITKQIQQDATVYQILFHIYMKLNMFRATYRPSSAKTALAASGFAYVEGC